MPPGKMKKFLGMARKVQDLWKLAGINQGPFRVCVNMSHCSVCFSVYV